MPLVVLCGHPCSGKSRVAEQLAQLFRDKGVETVVVDEASLHLERNAAYRDMPSEKNTRGLLKSAADRALARAKRRLVILDSMNAIKGFRFELFCLARQAATKYAMAEVYTPVETCREWNRSRPEDERWADAIFEDLASRFERPDSRNRWEAPLFTLRPALGEESLARGLADVAAALGLSGKEGAAAAAAATEQRAVEELKPNLATHVNCHTLSSTNLQYEIDRAAQAVLERIAEAQAAAGAAPPGLIAFPAPGSSSGSSSGDNASELQQQQQGSGRRPNGGGRGGGGSDGAGAAKPLTLDVCRPLLLPELRRHKRAFMKLATNQTWIRLPDAAAAQRLFVDYLRQQLAAAT